MIEMILFVIVPIWLIGFVAGVLCGRNTERI